MRNITLNADENIIEIARAKAKARKTTLNAEFRRWIQQYAKTDNADRKKIEAYRELMADLGTNQMEQRKFSRDEMNERR